MWVNIQRLTGVAHCANVVWPDLARCVVFGSFVTAKLLPNDVDVFLLMEDTFDMSQLTGEARLLFEHAAAQTRFGASVFWLRRLAVLDDEQTTLSHW